MSADLGSSKLILEKLTHKAMLGVSGEYAYTPPYLITIVKGTFTSGLFINNLSLTIMNLASLKCCDIKVYYNHVIRCLDEFSVMKILHKNQRREMLCYL